MAWDPAAARSFVSTNGRVLDQRLMHVLFDGDPADTVVWALMGHRNSDGGFGHGLEPDKRTPASQPLDVEIAFDYLVAANADAPAIASEACDWLTSIADPTGAVPPLLADTLEGSARAAHWQATEFAPGVNPTAAIAAHAQALGVEHPWVERATDYSLGEIEAGRVPSEGHDLLCLTKLLATAPDRDRVEPLADALRKALMTASFMKLDPNDDTYGLTPLHFAPTPDSLAAAWFDDVTLTAFLDSLEDEQQADGGWPVSWEPPGPASALEWRAIITLNAIRTLHAYDRAPLV